MSRDDLPVLRALPLGGEEERLQQSLVDVVGVVGERLALHLEDEECLQAFRVDDVGVVCGGRVGLPLDFEVVVLQA